MSNEKFFRMLSVALLGGLALACVPDSQASSPLAPIVAYEPHVPVEIEIVREIDEINAGRFNPAVAGETNSSEAVESLLAPDIVTLSQFDPNL